MCFGINGKNGTKAMQNRTAATVASLWLADMTFKSVKLVLQQTAIKKRTALGNHSLTSNDSSVLLAAFPSTLKESTEVSKVALGFAFA